MRKLQVKRLNTYFRGVLLISTEFIVLSGVMGKTGVYIGKYVDKTGWPLIANQRRGIELSQSAARTGFDSRGLLRSIRQDEPRGARYLDSTNQSPELARLDDDVICAVSD